jgi:hypothetical protein
MTQLTGAEWKRVLPLLGNFKPERRQAAHNRLVKGWTLAKSGALYGYSRCCLAVYLTGNLQH